MPDDQIKFNLSPEEETELRQGQEVYATTKTAGWAVIEGWLRDVAFHSWVDPREVQNEDEWKWREMNAFHAANNARELLESIQKITSRSEYLDKIKNGEIQRKMGMKI